MLLRVGLPTVFGGFKLRMSTVAQRRADEVERSARLVTSPPTEGLQPHNAVLASLPADDARAFRELARPTPLLRGAALHRAGDAPAWLYFIERGLVSQRVNLGSGREIAAKQHDEAELVDDD